ncbi:hypothetical protein AWZ03_001160, partial [Drosophila navojoa]
CIMKTRIVQIKPLTPAHTTTTATVATATAAAAATAAINLPQPSSIGPQQQQHQQLRQQQQCQPASRQRPRPCKSRTPSLSTSIRWASKRNSFRICVPAAMEPCLGAMAISWQQLLLPLGQSQWVPQQLLVVLVAAAMPICSALLLWVRCARCRTSIYIKISTRKQSI